jgi:hypothetical protein
MQFILAVAVVNLAMLVYEPRDAVATVATGPRIS